MSGMLGVGIRRDPSHQDAVDAALASQAISIHTACIRTKPEGKGFNLPHLDRKIPP